MPGNANGKRRRSLSALLDEVSLSGRTWCYADFSDDAGCSLAAGNAVFVHAVIHGQVRLACSGGAMTELGPGDVAMVLSGEAHALRTSSGARALAHDTLRHEGDFDVPPACAFGAGSRIAARVLSGRLAARWPAEVARSSLPSLMRSAGAFLKADALPLAGIGAGSTALLTRLAEALLVAALRADPACRRLLSAEKHDPIEEAVQLIAASPAQPWTVESLARAVGMGRSNFAAHFTQGLGKAPMEVVAEHRMKHAAMLLRQGRMKIAEIAELAGYGSEAAFSRRFSRHFGISPSQLREETRMAREQAASVKPQRLHSLLASERKRPVEDSGAKPSEPPSRGKASARGVFIARGRRD